VPVELLTTIGDAVHNMRSCLDSAAHELARQHLGCEMTELLAKASQFPICKDRAEFDRFFEAHALRRDMYGPRERDTMRCVQPLAFRKEAAAHGLDWPAPPEIEYRYD
jgi:hypothetical protein